MFMVYVVKCTINRSHGYMINIYSEATNWAMIISLIYNMFLFLHIRLFDFLGNCHRAMNIPFNVSNRKLTNSNSCSFLSIRENPSFHEFSGGMTQRKIGLKIDSVFFQGAFGLSSLRQTGFPANLNIASY